MPTDDLRAAFARAAADDGIVLGPQTFDWPCVQGYLGLERVAKARRDPAIAEPVKSALENLGAIYARLKGSCVGIAGGAAAYERHRAALISYLIR